MKSQLITIDNHGVKYEALKFWCPGCEKAGSGLHILAVNTDKASPSWNWNNNLEKPTLSPSILTGKMSDFKCHSFLTDGVFKFLGDSTHSLKNTSVPIPDLPDWAIK